MTCGLYVTSEQNLRHQIIHDLCFWHQNMTMTIATPSIHVLWFVGDIRTKLTMPDRHSGTSSISATLRCALKVCNLFNLMQTIHAGERDFAPSVIWVWQKSFRCAVGNLRFLPKAIHIEQHKKYAPHSGLPPFWPNPRPSWSWFELFLHGQSSTNISIWSARACWIRTSGNGNAFV